MPEPNHSNENHTENDPEMTQREERLDRELRLVRKMRLALASTLHMFEAARDDLVGLGNRMDRLRATSELCRKALREKKAKEDEEERMQLGESTG
jgi:PleD family two-component response regulator